ncbi:MAG: hypothetical protein HC938_11005 [Nitrospira sp.]|nr:hypothetical protein [Nitrospira sp.]
MRLRRLTPVKKYAVFLYLLLFKHIHGRQHTMSQLQSGRPIFSGYDGARFHTNRVEERLKLQL